MKNIYISTQRWLHTATKKKAHVTSKTHFHSACTIFISRSTDEKAKQSKKSHSMKWNDEEKKTTNKKRAANNNSLSSSSSHCNYDVTLCIHFRIHWKCFNYSQIMTFIWRRLPISMCPPKNRKMRLNCMQIDRTIDVRMHFANTQLQVKCIPSLWL